MIIRNSTTHSLKTALQEAVLGFPCDGLTVELKYCPRGSCKYASGTYYRIAKGHEDGKLIRLRINRSNRYPIEARFRTSQYERKTNARGEVLLYQTMRTVKFDTPEDLILAIFLHEFSHYIDHMEGRNGRYKQTKADKFAVKILEDLGVIP